MVGVGKAPVAVGSAAADAAVELAAAARGEGGMVWVVSGREVAAAMAPARCPRAAVVVGETAAAAAAAAARAAARAAADMAAATEVVTVVVMAGGTEAEVEVVEEVVVVETAVAVAAMAMGRLGGAAWQGRRTRHTLWSRAAGWYP